MEVKDEIEAIEKEDAIETEAFNPKKRRNATIILVSVYAFTLTIIFTSSFILVKVINPNSIQSNYTAIHNANDNLEDLIDEEDEDPNPENLEDEE